ncbi:hypothetical protein BRD01_02580 [Halobacteriales archaeon QS_8_65_32]|nr:MAG: hypothetical protein BRD01_02580 [Halobacteriales archaeon QS_8_65_32]
MRPTPNLRGEGDDGGRRGLSSDGGKGRLSASTPGSRSELASRRTVVPCLGRSALIVRRGVEDPNVTMRPRFVIDDAGRLGVD